MDEGAFGWLHWTQRAAASRTINACRATCSASAPDIHSAYTVTLTRLEWLQKRCRRHLFYRSFAQHNRDSLPTSYVVMYNNEKTHMMEWWNWTISFRDSPHFTLGKDTTVLAQRERGKFTSERTNQISTRTGTVSNRAQTRYLASPRRSYLPNLKSLAQIVLKRCSIVCLKF